MSKFKVRSIDHLGGMIYIEDERASESWCLTPDEARELYEKLGEVLGRECDGVGCSCRDCPAVACCYLRQKGHVQHSPECLSRSKP